MRVISNYNPYIDLKYDKEKASKAIETKPQLNCQNREIFLSGNDYNPVWERIHNSASELKKTMLLNLFLCLYNTFNKQGSEKKNTCVSFKHILKINICIKKPTQCNLHNV